MLLNSIYFYQMQGVRVNTIIDDPLAGCLDVVKLESNAINLFRSLSLRLQLFHKEKVCKSIGDQIIKESKTCGIYVFEYIINEIQYESRLAMRKLRKEYTDQFEEAVLKNWIKQIIKNYSEDFALEFLTKLKGNRTKRKR